MREYSTRTVTLTPQRRTLNPQQKWSLFPANSFADRAAAMTHAFLSMRIANNLINEPRDEDAPPVENNEPGSFSAPATLATVEALAPSIEVEIATVEAKALYAARLERARINFALHHKQQQRLRKVADSMMAAGQNPAHVTRQVRELCDKMDALRIEFWPDDLTTHISA